MSQIVIAHSAQSVFLQKLRESAGNIIRLDDISDFIDTHIACFILFSYQKQSGLVTVVKPAEPVITTPFAPPLQWTIRKLPSASFPPTMPT